jgi:tetratricopeptide (TPR) repeat protein
LFRIGGRLPLAFTLAAALFGSYQPASAQPAPEAGTSVQISETDAAGLLIDAGQIETAKLVLTHVLQTTPNDLQAHFLRGLIAVSEKNYDAAIADFRFVLAAEPDRERVRLELGRAFFLAGDYENAERNFRFARAGGLPDDAKSNIDQYLGAVQRLKEWSYNIGFAVAQDTNVNGATNVHQVDIYGLPFTLSDNARQKSGAGIALDVGGEWSPIVIDNWKAKLGGQIHRVEYGGSAFDDMTISAYAGPEYLLPRWQFDTLVTGFRRWYGNTPYSNGLGGRLAARYVATQQVLVGMALDSQAITYRQATEQNGSFFGANADVAYIITPSSLVRLSGGIATLTAKVSALASTTEWLAFDYYQDLPLGFSAGVEPAFSWTHYHAPLGAFGVTRDDHLWAIRLDVLNRRIEYRGFAPRLSFIYANQSSTIALYRYSRFQVQVGLTRQF